MTEQAPVVLADGYAVKTLSMEDRVGPFLPNSCCVSAASWRNALSYTTYEGYLNYIIKVVSPQSCN